MPLSADGFGQELIKKPSLDLHARRRRDESRAGLGKEKGDETGEEREEEECRGMC